MAEISRLPKHVKIIQPSKQRTPISATVRPVTQPTRPTPQSRKEPTTSTPRETRDRREQRKKKPDLLKVAVKRHKSKPDFITNGSTTVKIEFLIGLMLIVLSPIGNPAIQPDQSYLKRLVSWTMIFMLLFPMSGSSKPGLVRLANASGAVILLTISVKGTRSGFGVDVPSLLNAIVAKIQPNVDPSSGT